MKRSKLVIRLGLLAVAVGLVVFALVRLAAREPVYRGRPLREWLVELDHGSSSIASYSDAQEAIRAMGTNSLPFLIGYLRSKDPPFHRQMYSLKARLGLLRKGGAYARDWHRRAAMACGELGQDGEPAFPAMIEACKDERAASVVALALSRMLPRSAPVLTNLLATGNVKTRSCAGQMLMTAGSHPQIEEMALTALLRALQDSDPAPRSSAASAFRYLYWDQRFDVVVPALARALNDPDPGVRGSAANSLGTFGSAAKPAVPELLKLFQDTNDFPRKRAAEALSKIDPEAAAKAAGK